MPYLLGCYWAPGHNRPSDLEYMRQLHTPAIRILDPDPQQIADAHAAVPGALLLPRDWALSEQHDDLFADPEGTGCRHAVEWRDKIDRWRSQVAGFPSDQQIVVVGVNEPRVWQAIDPVVRYTVAFLDSCAAEGLRACALNLSVGWPAQPQGAAKPDWSPYAPVEAAIARYGHFLVLHEYWYWTGPRDGFGWYAGRYLSCPWDVPVIIGECGIDCYCQADRWNQDGGNRGWLGHVSPAEYAGQIHEYVSHLDDRLFAVLPFTTDYRSSDWSTFDTDSAHDQLVLCDWNLALPEFGESQTPVPPAASVCHPAPGGVITQHFFEGGPQFGMPGHDGTDLALAAGSPILAIADGEVAYTGWDEGYGYYVRLYHPSLCAHSFYAHLDGYAVSAGQPVTSGQPVGHCGSTGNSTGPHLHFEIRLAKEDGSYSELAPMASGRCDPETFMAQRGIKL